MASSETHGLTYLPLICYIQWFRFLLFLFLLLLFISKSWHITESFFSSILPLPSTSTSLCYFFAISIFYSLHLPNRARTCCVSSSHLSFLTSQIYNLYKKKEIQISSSSSSSPKIFFIPWLQWKRWSGSSAEAALKPEARERRWRLRSSSYSQPLLAMNLADQALSLRLCIARRQRSYDVVVRWWCKPPLLSWDEDESSLSFPSELSARTGENREKAKTMAGGSKGHRRAWRRFEDHHIVRYLGLLFSV